MGRPSTSRYSPIPRQRRRTSPPGYSDLFKQAASVTDTGIIVNDLMMSTLKTSSPASAALDGRVRSSSEI